MPCYKLVLEVKRLHSSPTGSLCYNFPVLLAEQPCADDPHDLHLYDACSSLQLQDDKNRVMQDKGVLGPARQQGFVGPLVYIGNTTTAHRLGCDSSACGCFFNFQQVSCEGLKHYLFCR